MSAELVQGSREGVWEIVLSGRAAGKPPLMNHAFLQALDHALAQCESPGMTPRVLVIRSVEPKFFCVGADVNALQSLDAESIGPWVELGHRALNRLEVLPVPVVAAVNGFCMGGGLELAMACDIIVAGEEAKFAQSEARLGFVTGWGGAARLRDRIGRGRAARMLFTGDVIDADHAFSMGVADVLAEPGNFDGVVSGLTASIAANSPGAIAAMKKFLALDVRASEHAYLEAERTASVSSVANPDTRSRVNAFLEERARRSAGQRPAVH